ncbi:MAG: hypothetical protein ACK5H2_10385 [Beutenbergiaceae bacterium]
MAPIRQKEQGTNRYGLIAQDHWRVHAPARYASLEDPEAFFTDLGQGVLTQVEQTAAELERDLPADLPYLERVAQLRAVQAQAEELALADLVYSVEPETASLVEELEQMLGQLPSQGMIQDALIQLDLLVQEDADWEDRDTVMTSEQQAHHDRLQALLPLVSGPEPEQMDEPTVRSQILALAPFLSPETPAR